MNKTATLGGGGGSNMQHIATLRQTLQQALQQNNILRGKLQKIQMDADISDLPQVCTFFQISVHYVITSLTTNCVSLSLNQVTQIFNLM